jgi:cation-transporting P-type ATPase E
VNRASANYEPASGLTGEEARRRLAERPRSRRPAGSRTYADIVRTNVLTLFNAILAALLAVVVALGDYRDGLFAGVLVANILIGVAQEIRAKRVLDRLALLVAPRARVYRDARLCHLPAGDVVTGDVIRVEPGDQVVADGRVVRARALSLDESILTGESDAVERAAGDALLSGAYCVAGTGDYVVEAVGSDSFAERLAAEARGTVTRLSPLQQDINRVLRVTVAVMVPLALLLVGVLAVRDTAFEEAGRTVVAGLLPLVPEGLVLLTSLTFAVAAVRLARLGTLAQRLNAVESLAAVDVVCLDKTGTLTDNQLRVIAAEPTEPAGGPALLEDLAALAASSGTRNGTLSAIAEFAPAAPSPVRAEVPFHSVRKWSAVELEDRGTLVLGAPDVLVAGGVPIPEHLSAQMAEQAARRRRVVLLARSAEALDGTALPPGLAAAGIVVLEEGLRGDAGETIAFLVREGIEVKIISGDGVDTVRAVALAAGVPFADRAIDGAALPAADDALAEVALTHAVFARVSPEQKRRLVRALTGEGKYVAMVGDGVNDVLALREARLAIAMGNGSQMAKGVSDLVLLTNAFATVPRAIEEGRRILRNTHRVARLFVTKSVYSALLLVTLGLAPIAYPFLPRHLTIISTLTVGLPGFFLALAASSGPVRRERFLRDLARFTLPLGAGAAAIIAGAYLVARGPLDRPVVEARTIAVGAAIAAGLAIVAAVERGDGRRVRGWVWGVLAADVAVALAGMALPPLRRFFELEAPHAAGWITIAAAGVAGVLLVLAAHELEASAAHSAEAVAPGAPPRT